MFHDCSSLTTIYVSDNFITTNVTRGNIVFDGCTALKGAIDYDANKTDCTYANYTNGYFTPEGVSPTRLKFRLKQQKEKD